MTGLARPARWMRPPSGSLVDYQSAPERKRPRVEAASEGRGFRNPGRRAVRDAERARERRIWP
jgi:hypothetical protein